MEVPSVRDIRARTIILRRARRVLAVVVLARYRCLSRMFWQIIIQDDDNLVGTSVARVIEQICAEVPFKFIRVVGFVGAADQALWARLEEENEPIGIVRIRDLGGSEKRRMARIDAAQAPKLEGIVFEKA